MNRTRITRSVIGIALLSIAAAPLATLPAHADPSGTGFPLTLVCPDASYQVVVPGRGEFTPALIVGRNGVLIPVLFGDTTITVSDEGGNFLFQVTDPGATKGKGNVAAHNPRPTVTCTYTLLVTAEQDPDQLQPGQYAEIAGSVTGHLVGRP